MFFLLSSLSSHFTVTIALFFSVLQLHILYSTCFFYFHTTQLCKNSLTKFFCDNFTTLSEIQTSNLGSLFHSSLRTGIKPVTQTAKIIHFSPTSHKFSSCSAKKNMFVVIQNFEDYKTFYFFLETQHKDAVTKEDSAIRAQQHKGVKCFAKGDTIHLIIFYSLIFNQFQRDCFVGIFCKNRWKMMNLFVVCEEFLQTFHMSNTF